jgi:hypothetical protein
MNGWKFFPQRNSVRQPLALVLAFVVGFCGTYPNQQIQDDPNRSYIYIKIPAPVEPIVPPKADCLPGFAPNMPCLSFAEIEKLMQETPDSDLLIHPNETKI